MKVSVVALAAAVGACLAGGASGFVTAPARGGGVSPRPSSALGMGLGDMFKGAFENEKFDSKAGGAGLSKAPKTCEVTVNGKTVQAIAGQKLSMVCQKAGAKIQYSCKNGECGTCEAFGDGKKIRICTAVVPMNAAKFTIKTK